MGVCLHLSFYMCMSMCLHALTAAQKCLCACGGQRSPWVFFLYCSTSCFLRQTLLDKELTSPARLTCQFHGSPCLHLPTAGVIDTHHRVWLLCVCWGLRLRSSYLCGRRFAYCATSSALGTLLLGVPWH